MESAELAQEQPRGMYHNGSRRLQDRFDTRRLADRLEEKFIGRPQIYDRAAEFLEAADMFFIATADLDAQPTCSYEGGEPGFVRVLDEQTLAFPSYDGAPPLSPDVGLLFISFTERKRVRLQGLASHDARDELLEHYPGAQFVTRVAVTDVFPNCPRYIHKYELVQRTQPRAIHREEDAGPELDGPAVELIEAADKFFIGTADAQGRPTCSYKGGDPGFVRVLDERTIAFPCYDGNGMFLTAGNVLVNPHVGLLFVDFEQRLQLRLRGSASHDEQDELIEHYPEAQFVTRVAVTEAFPVSAESVHEYKLLQRSRFIPKAECETPSPAWKRENWAVDVLRANDPALAPDAEIIHKG